ncbi:MAG: SDR family oxidoreductase [Bryobacteraceae bacterium]|jgi:NAD(P)-dependent dehydrogenase (short-subunit alcohol dehydrogenase family)
MDLNGRVAVVIGGTSGIGRKLAAGLAAAGADVVPTGRREALIDEACGEIERAGRKTLRHACDAGSRASIDRFRDAVLAQFGHVDVLLNAAGQTFRQATQDVSEADWNRILDVNLTGTLRSCQSFHAALAANRRGRIINIASLTSFVGFLEVTAYAASKAAVLGLTRNLAVEWARDGISVNAIAPGVFRTDLNAALLDGTERGCELKMRTPMGRFGQLEELVGAAVLLASDSASFITGQCIAVDGGFLASGVNQ